MGTNGINKNRRKFFQTTAALIGGALAGTFLKPIELIAQTNEEATEEDQKENLPLWGMGVDIDKCIGCGKCAEACKIENNVPKEPFYFRTWVEQYTVKKDGEVKIESPNGGIGGLKQSVPDEDIFKSFMVPKLCNHCSNAPCVQACPVGATYISPDGVVLVDETYCIGCSYCIQACPYGARFMNPFTKVADKCTFCYHRISKGQQPACVEVCPTDARIFGDLRDKKSDLVKFLQKNQTEVLKPHLNTKSRVFYNGLSSEVR
jgi:Fe-S-cluster-containing dehydrogenase component